MDGWMDGLDGWKGGLMDRMDGWMVEDRWVDGKVGGWMDGWMDRWMGWR